MPTTPGPQPAAGDRGRRMLQTARVIVVGSIMFTFISYWRVAAVVLCDLASTAYYIGGIVEQAIGPAAPWFILAVMLFSYCVRWVYIESCTLFVRGGVYRVVREALGRLAAKLAVSALMFDYLLTGPISGVSAGQYLVGLGIDALRLLAPHTYTHLALDDESTREFVKHWGSVAIACAVTLYFLRLNWIGLHESSDKALKIMAATTVMAVVVLAWCGYTLATRPAAERNPLPRGTPDLSPKWEYADVTATDRVTGATEEMWRRDPTTGGFAREKDSHGHDVPKRNPVTGLQEDPLGFLRYFPSVADRLRAPGSWLSLVGVLGLFIAFGHSILAMSGEETLAQVYREVESPKLKNFKKAALVVFIYSLVLTAGISFLAVMLIPDEVRMRDYRDNLISGLALYVAGPAIARLVLNAFVVVVGFFILAGAVNTAMIGSNGVLNRVAEDGVMPEWFLKPHPRYGTTYRVLLMISGLQLLIILASRGDTFLLGEAYAFGVVWSFVFQALSMVVLRFKDPRPREFKVPLNIRIGRYEVPIGLSLILVILLVTATMNFLTKEVATVSGVAFTGLFFTMFSVSEWYYERRRRGLAHQHLEQFNRQVADRVDPQALGLDKPYRKLVAIRSPQNLYMLEKTLAETDPETTDVVVMTAKLTPVGETPLSTELDPYDQALLTAVVQRAERAGKQVKPLILPTNNPLYAILRTARDLGAQEVVLGASNKYSADEQLEQTALYWSSLSDGGPVPLTVRILGRDRDVYLDLAGGSRIPKLSDKARSVEELRRAGLGVQRVLLTHAGTRPGSDLFEAVLTMLDPQIALTVVPLASPSPNGTLGADLDRAQKLGREVRVQPLADGGRVEDQILRLAREGDYDLVIAGVPTDWTAEPGPPLDGEYLWAHAPCPVLLAAPPAVPQEPEAPPTASSPH